jgi:hypothetical protein
VKSWSTIVTSCVAPRTSRPSLLGGQPNFRRCLSGRSGLFA